MLLKSILFELKRWLKPIFIFALMLFLLFIATIGFHEKEVSLELALENFPEELIALLGLSKNNPQELCRQFFFVILSIISMISIGIICTGIIKGLKKEEQENTLIFYINQPWSKGAFWSIKFLAAAFRIVGLWLIYLMECLILIYFLSKSIPAYTNADYSLIFKIGKNSFCILIFSFGLCLLYSAKKYQQMGIGNLIITIYTLSFLIGNAYKLSDYMLYYLLAAQKDADQVIKIGNLLNRLHFLYPFSCFDMNSPQALSGQVITGYTIIGVLMAAGAWILCYNKKVS